MNSELCATVLALNPLRAATFPANQSRSAHALFLRLIGQVDPSLATHLHEAEQARPFTCSNVWREGIGTKGTGGKEIRREKNAQPATRTVQLASCSPGETWFVRYTTLSTDLSALWMERILPNLPDQIVLDDAAFGVDDALTTTGAHPWAGHTSYADLASPYLLGSAPAPSRWSFSFASPTAFRSGGKTMPIPLPDLLFGSLLDRWNAWSPVALSPEARRFAAECVAVSNYHLRTRALPGKMEEPGKAVTQRGAVGRCDYAALNKDRYWLSALSVLAAFAFYSGAGYQTTQGMGMVRWLRN